MISTENLNIMYEFIIFSESNSKYIKDIKKNHYEILYRLINYKENDDLTKKENIENLYLLKNSINEITKKIQENDLNKNFDNDVEIDDNKPRIVLSILQETYLKKLNLINNLVNSILFDKLIEKKDIEKIINENLKIDKNIDNIDKNINDNINDNIDKNKNSNEKNINNLKKYYNKKIKKNLINFIDNEIISQETFVKNIKFILQFSNITIEYVTKNNSNRTFIDTTLNKSILKDNLEYFDENYVNNNNNKNNNLVIFDIEENKFKTLIPKNIKHMFIIDIDNEKYKEIKNKVNSQNLHSDKLTFPNI